MMKSVQAYYDGKTFIPIQDYTFRPQQRVLIVVDDNDEQEDSQTVAQKFLQLSWAGDETAEEILANIKDSRKNSKRFGEENALFN